MMRGTTIGLIGGTAAVAVWAALHAAPSANAQGNRQATGAQLTSAIPMLKLDAGAMGDHVVVFDQNTKVICIYFVERKTGALSLRSVRNINWDVQLEEYNATTPSPKEIRAIIEGRP